MIPGDADDDGALPPVVPGGASDRVPLPSKDSALYGLSPTPTTSSAREGRSRRRSVVNALHFRRDPSPGPEPSSPRPELSPPSMEQTQVRSYLDVNFHPVLTCFKAPSPPCRLEVLYPPQGTQDPPATVDIVTVGHFGKDHESTWICIDPTIPATKEQSTKKRLPSIAHNKLKLSKETQPIDWLSNEVMLRKAHPGARVLQFGYPITSGPDRPQVALDWVAEELRRLLLKFREHCPYRPIVFIGHNVGVVVIEQALIQISELPKEEGVARHILESTAGIIFLATPSPDADSSDYFAGRDSWFSPKGTTSPASPHLLKFRSAVGKKNVFLARLPWSTKSPGSDDTKHVLDLVRRFENSRGFLDAASKREADVVKGLLDQGVDSNVQNGSGQSALHIAVQNDDIRMVRILLGNRSTKIALQDNRGQSALHLAVQTALRPKARGDGLQEDKSNVVELLLEKGADAKALDKTGRSAADLANDSQNKELKLLLAKPPLVEGPSQSMKPKWEKPKPPGNSNAVSVCKKFRATLTEFFLIGETEKRNIEKHASVYEVLYDQGPESILNDVRQPTVEEKRTCRWFHIPSNNVSGLPSRS